MIWRLRVQQHVKVFIWIFAYVKILTNYARWRRRLTLNAVCSRCGQEREYAIHAIRDCEVAKEVWKHSTHYK